jgi:hypothetical protein
MIIDPDSDLEIHYQFFSRLSIRSARVRAASQPVARRSATDSQPTEKSLRHGAGTALAPPSPQKEGGAMNLMISLGVLAVLGAPAANVIPVAHLWTPVVRLALGLEVLWWTGALAFLVWLTRPSAPDKSQPPKPKRGAKEDGADGARRLAA